MLGDTNSDFKRKLLRKTEEKVRGYRSVALNHYCGNGYAFCVMISRKLGLGGIGGGVASAAILGMAVPFALRLLRLEPRVAAGPIALAGADVITLLLYLNLAHWLLR